MFNFDWKRVFFCFCEEVVTFRRSWLSSFYNYISKRHTNKLKLQLFDEILKYSVFFSFKFWLNRNDNTFFGFWYLKIANCINHENFAIFIPSLLFVFCFSRAKKIMLILNNLTVWRLYSLCELNWSENNDYVKFIKIRVKCNTVYPFIRPR